MMRPKPQCGVLVVSIDVDEDPSRPTDSEYIHAAAGPRAVHEAAKWMLDRLGELRLPATWFFANPGTGARRLQIAAADAGHEIGLLLAADRHAPFSRQQLRRKLEQQSQALRAVGIGFSSLAIRSPGPIDHLDLLAKHGIRAVRLASLSICPRAQKQLDCGAMTALRFGIFSLPATACIDRAPWWKRWINLRRHCNYIAAAARARQYCHLAFNLRALSDIPARNRANRILLSAAKHFRSPQTCALTMSAAASAFMAQPRVQGARSILRAA